MKYNDLAENAGRDDDIGGEERETTIGWAAVDDMARFFSEETYVMKRILTHPAFELQWYQVRDDDTGEIERKTAEDYEEDGFEGGTVIRVRGLIPTGAVKIQPNVRDWGGHANTVTDKFQRGE